MGFLYAIECFIGWIAHAKPSLHEVTSRVSFMKVLLSGWAQHATTTSALEITMWLHTHGCPVPETTTGAVNSVAAAAKSLGKRTRKQGTACLVQIQKCVALRQRPTKKRGSLAHEMRVPLVPEKAAGLATLPALQSR